MSEPDRMDVEYFNELVEDWPGDAECSRRAVALLTSQLAIWRGRSNYWRGKCEGMTETIAYLKQRLDAAELAVARRIDNIVEQMGVDEPEVPHA